MNLPPMAKGLCVLFFLLIVTALAWTFDSPPRAQAEFIATPREHHTAGDSILAPAGILTVTTNADNGAGSLRDAIASAGPGDTINFSLTLPATITLTTSQLSIAQDLTINGPGASLLAVSGGNTFRVFNISSGSVTMSGVTIRDGNDQSIGLGGGVNNAGALTLTNTTVFSNTAVSGAAGINNTGNLIVSSSSLLSNTKPTGVGGGIYNHAGGYAMVDQSTIAGNHANVGGGIFNEGSLTLTNSTLSGNIGSVSGIYIANATLTMSNTTVTGDSGGTNVIFLISSGSGLASATLLNSTIVSNTENGILMNAFNSATSTVSLKNSIIANNNGVNNIVVISGTLTSLGHNLSNGTIPNATTGDQQNVADIRVGALANNGGATQTMALLPGSPAINAGSNSGCPATDQRGALRPRTTQNPCDIGAFENSYLYLPLIKK